MKKGLILSAVLVLIGLVPVFYRADANCVTSVYIGGGVVERCKLDILRIFLFPGAFIFQFLDSSNIVLVALISFIFYAVVFYLILFLIKVYKNKI